MNKGINCKQLFVLRSADDDGDLGCDRSTGKALVARGFAEELEIEDGDGRFHFVITPAGRARARLKADYRGKSEAGTIERIPELMQDLPEERGTGVSPVSPAIDAPLPWVDAVEGDY